MSQADSSRKAHDWQTRNSQNERLRRISRASLYLTGAVILLTYLPALAFMAEALALIALAVALIGMGARVWLWRVQFKQTNYG